MATYRAKDRYARLTKEATWGTYDATGNILYPVLVGDDGLNMVRSPGNNILETNIGHVKTCIEHRVRIRAVIHRRH